MVNTILAFDELDTSLGSFFSRCKQHLDEFFLAKEINTDQLSSNTLNDLAVTLLTDKYSHFVFGAYSHGDKNNLLKSAITPYISISLNGSNFNNSFFYTFSCSSGKELGKDLIDQQCLCFIGYKNDVAIWDTFQEPFVECANFGLIQFYKGHSTFSIIDLMKEKYNEKIDEIYKTDFVIASILMDNRNALVLHGEELDVNDLT